jgi:hypothetical protein
MGLIRGVLLVLAATLLFLAFLSLNLLWTLSSSLTYDNVQKEATGIATDTLKEAGVTDNIKQLYPQLQIYCQKNHSEYVLNYQEFSFEIPCSAVLQGEDAIMNEVVKGAINNIYYTRYDCNFIDCFRKFPIPLFLLSQKAYYFWSDNTYFALIASFVLFILVFLLVQKKTNAFILSGSLLIVSSLFFVKLDYILSLFSGDVVFKLIWIFFSQSYFVSIKTLLSGVGLLALGILMDIFKVGFFISNLISKIKGKKEEKAEKKSTKKSRSKSK